MDSFILNKSSQNILYKNIILKIYLAKIFLSTLSQNIFFTTQKKIFLFVNLIQFEKNIYF